MSSRWFGLRSAAVLFAATAATRISATPIVHSMHRRIVTVPTDLSIDGVSGNATTAGAVSFESLRLFRLLTAQHGNAGNAASAALARHLQDAVDLFGPFRQLAYYYADLFIGTPPQRFSVITDTGSSLTAVPCDSCGPQCGTHMNPRYAASASSSSVAVGCEAGCSGCTDSGQCRYSQGYAEGSSIEGVVYSDTAFIGDERVGTGGGPGFDAATRVAHAVRSFQFGCQTREGGLFLTQKADGIMGVGQGPRSFVRALWEGSASPQLVPHNMFSLCLGLDSSAMTMGDVATGLHLAPPRWAALTLTGFYVVTVESMGLTDSGSGSGTGAEGQDAEPLPISTANLNSPGRTILDSGTTFTYLPASAFAQLTAAVDTICSRPGRCRGSRVAVSGEGICYRLQSPADIATFPALRLALRAAEVAPGQPGGGSGSENGGGPVVISVAPQHLFLNMGWDGGAYCLGAYSQGSNGAGAVLGANAMMGHDVIFDMGASRQPETAGPPRAPRVGFAPSRCNLAETDSGSGSTATPSPALLAPSPSGSVPPPSPSSSASPSASLGESPSPSPSQSPSQSQSPSPAAASASASAAASAPASASASAAASAPASASASASGSLAASVSASLPPGSSGASGASGGSATDADAASLSPAPLFPSPSPASPVRTHEADVAATVAAAERAASVQGALAVVGAAAGLCLLCCAVAACRRGGLSCRCCGMRCAVGRASAAAGDALMLPVDTVARPGGAAATTAGAARALIQLTAQRALGVAGRKPQGGAGRGSGSTPGRYSRAATHDASGAGAGTGGSAFASAFDDEDDLEIDMEGLGAGVEGELAQPQLSHPHGRTAYSDDDRGGGGGRGAAGAGSGTTTSSGRAARGGAPPPGAPASASTGTLSLDDDDDDAEALDGDLGRGSGRGRPPASASASPAFAQAGGKATRLAGGDRVPLRPSAPASASASETSRAGGAPARAGSGSVAPGTAARLPQAATGSSSLAGGKAAPAASVASSVNALGDDSDDFDGGI